MQSKRKYTVFVRSSHCINRKTALLFVKLYKTDFRKAKKTDGLNEYTQNCINIHFLLAFFQKGCII